MTEPINGGGAPLRPVRVLTVPADRPVAIRLLGGYTGMMTHWFSGRSRACLGEKLCPPTRHKALSVWKGYAPSECWNNVAEHWEPVVLEITESLEERFRGRKLRGEGWLLSRDNKADAQSPIVAMFCEQYDTKKLRPAFDVFPVLARIYHEKALALDIPNPIPPRLMLASEAGVAPNLVRELSAADPKDREATPEEIRHFKARMQEMFKGKKAPDTATAAKGAAGTHGRNGREKPV